MKRLTMFAVLGIVGCASQPQVEWVASRSIDQFTDKTECIATVGSYYANSSIYTVNGRLYPFVKQSNGELWVGVKSGGKFPVPVGDVQLRIDANEAWTIETSETPTDGLRSAVKYENFLNLDSYPEEQKEIIKAAYAQSSEATKQMTAPYTVATGNKAKKILNEMLNGNTLIYRSLGAGYGLSPSEPGKFKLDDSLKSALKQCNITI